MNKQGFNPYLPSREYIPDGEPHVFEDRLYVFGSHDRFNDFSYCANDYVCWSTPVDNMKEWRYEGIIYRKNQDPLNPKGKMQLWAPDVQQGCDGRYYLYYSFTFQGWIGVAVSDTPAGPYEFYGHVHYKDGSKVGTAEGDAFQFDPGVLVDDDGKIYVYTGYAPRKTGVFPGPKDKRHEGGYVMELEQDMITVKVTPQLVFPMEGNAQGSGFEGHEFYEASSIRKINGKYYFVYSSINGHELCYATSDKPMEGFQYKGIIISNGDIGYRGRKKGEALNYTANNHGGIVQVKGQWYIFYHRHTNRQQTSRQGCAEPVVIMEDGSIPQVEMTSSGLNGRSLEGKGTYEARIACNLLSKKGTYQYPYITLPFLRKKEHPFFTQSGKDREGEGDQFIANMCDGAKAGFKYFNLTKTNEIKVKVRGNAKGVLWVTAQFDKGQLAKIKIEINKECKEFKSAMKPSSEKSALYFIYQGKGKLDFIDFTLS